MTVNDISKLENFEPLVIEQGEREVKGGYIGDLLSWVMGRAKQDDAWITIMTNINIVAVAALTDVSCIIIAEGAKPEQEVLDTAKEKEINIISSSLPAYETALLLQK